MDPKRPNHQIYLEVLRRLTPEQGLLKAFELTEQSHKLFRAGVRLRFPDAGPRQQQRIHLDQLEQCRNRSSKRASSPA